VTRPNFSHLTRRKQLTKILQVVQSLLNHL
jgi:hypothetical protein